MKETHFFYCPNPSDGILPSDEATHATRVLRLAPGDSLNVIDGQGNLFSCTITRANGNTCIFKIESAETFKPLHSNLTSIAVAPTKNIDRMEWFVEKATEIGIDQINFLKTQFSERKVIKIERLEKIVVSAVKQSHKFYMPQLSDLQDFNSFINEPFDGLRCIAHCYMKSELPFEAPDKQDLFELLKQQPQPTQVLIGPEGDFSITEVKAAIDKGFVPISLGHSRLRTETAALVAVHLMHLFNEIKQV